MTPDTVAIRNDYYVIDADAWIGQRAGSAIVDSTADLRAFIRLPLWQRACDRLDVVTRVEVWCAARDWLITEGSPLAHDDTALSRPVTIILATTPDPDSRPVAIVVDDGHATVYPDRTTDEGVWSQPNTVDLVCPSRHRHTWLGDAEAIDNDGNDTTIRALFGPDPRAPYRTCRTCESYERDPSWLLPCPCGGVSAIYCPACGDRCHLELPDVATHPFTGGTA